ncbi:MAG: AAA family ATPase [bacterium]|nr:AAA family ATPase [bacterium]
MGVDPDGLGMAVDGTTLPTQEIGDGFGITAALVTDLLRRLYEAYGGLRIDEGPPSGDDLPGAMVAPEARQGAIRVTLPGVVFIDEVEQHLHASWQQGIGFWLKEHFPALQFLVATHSPFVCQAATPGGLFRMPGSGERHQVERVPDEVFNAVVHGTTDDAVLSELFGLERPYSDASERLRDRIAELEVRQQTGELSTAEREELVRLSASLPHSPGANLDQMLRRLEAKL